MSNNNPSLLSLTVLIGFLYIVQEREFVNSNQPIYKIGETDKINPQIRLRSYPKGSIIHFTNSVKNSRQAENILKETLRNHPNIIYRRDLGSVETFQGDLQIIKEIIMDICKNVDNNNFGNKCIITSDILCEENKQEFITAFDRDYLITKDFKNDYFECNELSKWAEMLNLSINTAVSINSLLRSEYGIDSSDTKWKKQKRCKVDGYPKKPARYCYFGIKKLHKHKL